MPVMKLGAMAVVVTLLGGCANINSIYRDVDVEGKAAAIDAKQRLVMSGTRSDGIPVICAEPSPDALSAYGSSIAGTANSERAQLQVAMAIAEQAGSIGLRTQSITLMRDSLYRVCEAYRSSALSPAEVYLLQRRFQNLTLGLLAVEQLTGTVKAQQIALTNQGGAATGDNAEAETKALAEAKVRLIEVQAEYDKAKIKSETERKEVTKATNAHNAALAKLDPQPDKQTQTQKDEVAATALALEEARKRSSDQDLDTETKRRLVVAASESVKAAEENLQLARQRVRAYASGTAEFGPGLVGGTNAQTVGSVAKSVSEIVVAVLRASNRDEVCNEVMRDALLPESVPKYQQAHMKTMLETCLYEKVLDAETAQAQAGTRGSSSTPPSPPAPPPNQKEWRTPAPPPTETPTSPVIQPPTPGSNPAIRSRPIERPILGPSPATSPVAPR